MAKYRVAVIGAGMIANSAHIPAYKRLNDRVEIVAVADNREAAAKDSAVRHGIPHWYPDANEMIQKEKPDIVSVCMSNMFHYKYTIAALKAGAHVFCEKPAAVSYQETKEMFDTAEKVGKKLIICQTARFGSETLAAKQFADKGILGDVYFADIEWMRRRGVPKWGSFHMKNANGGGAFCDLGIHAFDMVLWIAGFPKLRSLCCNAATRLTGKEPELYSTDAESGAFNGVFMPRKFDVKEFSVEEFANGTAFFENGLTINFKIAWSVNLPESRKFDIAGTKAGIRLPSMEIYSGIGGYQADITPHYAPYRYERYKFGGHHGLIEHGINVIDGKEELLIKPNEILTSAAILDGFYKSVRLGREVTVEEVTGETAGKEQDER